mmetsp:Transcript_1674/g.2401  ORF Transcript_1674/g.2401 Transcript_1674/m.2401 type:complete len:117 (+) Transcript_1674:111-461(+)|eukprot:CAMPEP_0198151422 /NCGR_PEP_ID=MMETSP1443-20131203/55538_1 /TAXON_ID=186043 /ORGANISM="Entomoneis sp., Strain CCMP2396" /LENGTH=116 /DNA_ID=CAMNT_0043817071 /DNA_START=83 /DNA_END=433 /DNA_ORIENTATION=+
MSKIPGVAHLNLSLGGLVIVGGTIGYLKKGSKVSMIAGLGVGSLLIGSGYMIAKTDKVYEAHLLATAASGVLAVAMGQRFVNTGKFMPVGMVAVIGAAGCAYNAMKTSEWAPSKSD